ncbi:uncharacterized protein M421DRAFT_284554 [Didymella exigua CBS 183.55]|uniref:Uncharacterized protein n=1 Tax=Didymella exigua CBS 183.55 TaxID=1150837 RepID=A0A6A5RWZ9_9PLEO|nr:uncharacterized protein M421DRAFT_284554 [Didymella exigua CBS 183.55]KAF1932103.1 hypothetical protein M421DRAFT_284554 [Didymella exigua CBS 183.55]
MTLMRRAYSTTTSHLRTSLEQGLTGLIQVNQSGGSTNGRWGLWRAKRLTGAGQVHLDLHLSDGTPFLHPAFVFVQQLLPCLGPLIITDGPCHSFGTTRSRNHSKPEPSASTAPNQACGLLSQQRNGNSVRPFAYLALGNRQHVSQWCTVPVCLAELCAEPAYRFCRATSATKLDRKITFRCAMQGRRAHIVWGLMCPPGTMCGGWRCTE